MSREPRTLLDTAYDARFALRPSAAHRWLTCCGSAVFAAFPFLKSTPTEAAARGTAVMGSLEYAMGGRPDERRDLLVDITKFNSHVDGFEIEFTDDDIDAAQEMLTIVESLESLGYVVHCEVPITVNVSYYVIKGRLDFIGVRDDALTVVDYKHGEGIPVSAHDNPQLMLYLLGAIHEFGERDRYEVEIIQPRSKRGTTQSSSLISQTVVSTWRKRFELAVNEIRSTLIAFSRDTSHDLNRMYCPGAHCWKCPGEDMCPGRLGHSIHTCVTRDTVVDELDESLRWNVLHGDEVKRAVNSANRAAIERIRGGKPIEGVKVIQLRKNLKAVGRNDPREEANLLSAAEQFDEVVE